MIIVFIIINFYPFRDAPNEEDGILCNYLPLIREYLPTAAEEIESDINGRASNGGLVLLNLFRIIINWMEDSSPFLNSLIIH